MKTLSTRQFNDLFVDAAGDAKKFVEDRALYLEEAKAALNAGSNGNGKGAVDIGKQVEGLRAVKVREQRWWCLSIILSRTL